MPAEKQELLITKDHTNVLWIEFVWLQLMKTGPKRDKNIGHLVYFPTFIKDCLTSSKQCKGIAKEIGDAEMITLRVQGKVQGALGQEVVHHIMGAQAHQVLVF